MNCDNTILSKNRLSTRLNIPRGTEGGCVRRQRQILRSHDVRWQVRLCNKVFGYDEEGTLPEVQQTNSPTTGPSEQGHLLQGSHAWRVPLLGRRLVPLRDMQGTSGWVESEWSWWGDMRRGRGQVSAAFRSDFSLGRKVVGGSYLWSPFGWPFYQLIVLTAKTTLNMFYQRLSLSETSQFSGSISQSDCNST